MEMNQLKQKFIEEAETLLTSLDNILIKLEKEANNNAVDEVFRVMHTIKGASGMFGFVKVVEITHEAETLYDLVRNGQLVISPDLLQITFSTADHIRALLVDESFANENNIKNHEILRSNFRILRNASAEIKIVEKKIEEKNDQGVIKTWNILFYPGEELVKRCINMLYTFQDLFALGEYKISGYSPNHNEIEFWNIFLVTEHSYDDIENALMFVMDFCKITEIANFNIFDAVSLDHRMSEFLNPSVKPNIDNILEVEVSKEHNPAASIPQSLNESKTVVEASQGRIASTRINVEVSKLNSLMYLVSELVTTKSELLIGIQRNNSEKVSDAAEKIDKLSKLFSDNALDIRLVSLSEMLQRFKRLIRDLAKQLGRNIDFIIEGEDTELDKTIIDALGEPIMHLIRNNIDHGIELPEIRVGKGKPANGIIRFEAVKTGNNVFITISDDGIGIDPAFIYNKAVEKGFVNAGTQLTNKEILNLIFLPGFSTAQSLTDVSGRGVGMDIVQKKIKEIRGEISISSEVGKGTAFTIKLQQTISIIDTLLIRANKTTYAIPVEDIEACLLETKANIYNQQNNLIVFDNELIPFVNLKGQYSESSTSNQNEKLVIINKKHKRYAIISDSILGEFQAVIKPLGSSFSEVQFLSGVSVLGDGSMALLIDTDKLMLEAGLNKAFSE